MPIDFDKPIGGPTPEEDRKILQERVNELNSLANQGRLKMIDKNIRSVEGFRVLGDSDARVVKMSEGRNDPRMLVMDFIKEDGEQDSVEVFIKSATRKNITNELECTRICKEGGVATFDPLVVADDQKAGYYITRRKNIIPFSEYYIQDFQDFEKLVELGVKEFKRVNDLGILHKDAKPKNIALDLETEDVVVYDFERAVIYPSGKLPEEVKNQDIFSMFLLEMKYDAIGKGEQAKRRSEYHWYHDHEQDVINLLQRIEDELTS